MHQQGDSSAGVGQQPPAGGDPQTAGAQRSTASERSTTPPRPWELIATAAGAVALVGSFLTFFSVPEEALGGADFSAGLSWSAWSNSFNLFPVAALVSLFAVAMGAQLALARYTGTTLPEEAGGFNWSELRLLLGVLGTLTMLGYLLRSFEIAGADLGVERGVGLWLVTLALVALLVSAVIERLEGRSPGAGRLRAGGELSQSGIIIMVAGAALLIGSFLTVINIEAGGESESLTAWSGWLFPLYFVPVLLGVVMAGQLALRTFASASLPERILGLGWEKIHLAFGAHAAVMMLGFLISEPFLSIFGLNFAELAAAGGGEEVGVGKGIGFWIMLVAALGLAFGAFRRHGESPRGANATRVEAAPGGERV